MNWKELPAGRELDRVVAERLGWTGFHTGTNLLGQRDLFGMEPYTEEMIRRAITWAGKRVKNYSTDADAAIALPVERGMTLQIIFLVEMNEYAARYVHIADASNSPDWHTSTNIAHAIVKAWLAQSEVRVTV
jgi:hypothetical protein